MELIVIIRGYKRTTHPQTVGEFKYIPKFDEYVYEGRSFKPTEFNEFMLSREWERVLERHVQRIRVKAIDSMAKARAARKPRVKRQLVPA